MIESNKYNAKTETQLRFSERIERELGIVCNFDIYVITRGRGWSKQDGSASASVAVQSADGHEHVCELILYHPLRDYLSKKKYISAWQEGIDVHIELEECVTQKGFLKVRL